MTTARAEGDAARERIARLSTRLDASTEERAEAQAAADQAEAVAALAEKDLLAALAGREALQARIAADDARYLSDPPDSKRADILAYAASHAERQAAALKASADVARAEKALADAKAAVKPGDAKSAQAVTAAEKALAEARKVDEKAQAERGKVAKAYSSLGPVYPATSTGRRLALAHWITSSRQPLDGARGGQPYLDATFRRAPGAVRLRFRA